MQRLVVPRAVVVAIALLTLSLAGGLSVATPVAAAAQLPTARAAGKCAYNAVPEHVMHCAAKAVNKGSRGKARTFATKRAVRQMFAIKKRWHYRFDTKPDCEYLWDSDGYRCTGWFYSKGKRDGYYTAFIQGTGSDLAVMWVLDSPHD